MFAPISADPGAKQALNPSLTWFGWAVPDALSAVLVLAIGIALVSVAIAEFARVE